MYPSNPDDLESPHKPSFHHSGRTTHARPGPTWAIALVIGGLLAAAALPPAVADPPQGSIVSWGHYANLVPPNTGFVGVSTLNSHILGLKADGSIVGWGSNEFGQANPPNPNSDFIAVAAGDGNSYGLKADGSIVAWGCQSYFYDRVDDRYYCYPAQKYAPSPNADFIAIARGPWHSLGLKADGSIVAWGCETAWSHAPCNQPAPNTSFMGIAEGGGHSLGLKADGSIVAWGDGTYGQLRLPEPNTDFVAVSAGFVHSLGLKADGSIVALGCGAPYNYGQCNVPAPNTDFVGVAAGGYHSLGLKADGSVVAWGRNNYGQTNVPAPNAGFVAIAAGAGGSQSLAIRLRPGDFDGDGLSDWNDYREFSVNLLGPAGPPAVDELHWFDLNDDGQVNLADFQMIQNSFTG